MIVLFARRTKFPPADRPRGFTLTEIAIVLGVIGLILGAIWSAASIVYEKTRFNSALNEYNIVSQNMTSLIQGGYGVAVDPCSAGQVCQITQAMLSAEAIPANYAVPGSSGTLANHPWDEAGGFTIWWVNGVYSNAAKYRMSFYGVTSMSGCVGLIMASIACKPGRPGCPVGIVVNEGLTSEFNTVTTTMTTAQAENLCAQNNYTNSGNNSVEFDFAN